MNTILKQEHAGPINGVPGRFHNVIIWPHNGKLANQQWTSERRKYKEHGRDQLLEVEIRFDDNCKNGHETFAITASGWEVISAGRLRETIGGCCHDEIAKVFPELAPLIKWHLCSTDGPMHYVANTVYHAGDLDHNGLRKGEKRQIRNGRTGELAWQLEAINSPGIGVSDSETGRKYANAETIPLYLLQTNCDGESPKLATPQLKWVPWCREGEGKERQLDFARSTAVWPEATDAELCLPKAELTALLMARLPSLIAAMRSEIEATGLLWGNPNLPNAA
jgi:hypothetical protein